MMYSRSVCCCLLIASIFIGIVTARNIAECDNQPSGNYINNPRDCEFRMIFCFGQNSQFCRAEAVCNEAFDCPNTSTTASTGTGTPGTLTPTTSTTPTPSVGSTTTTPLPDVRHLCQNGIYQKFPYPYNCNYYYQCIDGYLLVQQCPFGIAFNVTKGTCAGLMRGNQNCVQNSSFEFF